MNPLEIDFTQRWQRILEGDTQAFAGLVDEFKNLVTSIAYSSTGDLASSEDIAQETFLVVWRSRQELRDPDKLVSWISAIARNLSRQWVRGRDAKARPGEVLDADEVEQQLPHPVESLVSEEEQRLVWDTLETIPEIYREVMVLYYRESHAIAEVALKLEITEETARQRLSRGRNLLRAEVERTIESALTRSRPRAHFTSSVVSLIAVSASSTAAQAATAATVNAVAKGAMQGVVLATAKGAASGAMAGAAGGALGVAGGLGGSWLGIKLPQLLAPTMTERKLHEREGRIVWRVSLLYMFITLASVAVPLILGPQPNIMIAVVLGNMLLGICFAAFCIVRGIRINKRVKQIRAEIQPEQDPNPTWLKDRIGMSNTKGMKRWVGRRVTSRLRFLGWPLYDFQVSDMGSLTTTSNASHARGWLAVGDKATGLIALGGYARGIVAIGGRTLGVICFGGLSLGIVSVGGCALGLLAIGGLAVGHSAIGGGAIGWQAAGGGAVGIHAANGGLAIAGNTAQGGMALSLKYAVGGVAKAPQSNTEAARQACEGTWMAKYIGAQAVLNDPDGFRQRLRIYSFILPIGISVALAVLLPLAMYRRVT